MSLPRLQSFVCVWFFAMSHFAFFIFLSCGCICTQLAVLALGSLKDSDGDYSSYLRKIIVRNGIIPQLIDTEPSALLHVRFDATRVYPGMELTPTDTKDEPEYLNWKDAGPSKFHSLLMIDPDAPRLENPTMAAFNEESKLQWQHWLLVNIPGADVSQAETLSVYVSPGPAQGSGLHHYVFLVFEQPQKLQFDEPHLRYRSPTNRSTFSVSSFITKYNLNPKPVAGNFFLSQWDEYVPILFKQMDAEAAKEESDPGNGAGSRRKSAHLFLLFVSCLMKKLLA